MQPTRPAELTGQPYIHTLSLSKPTRHTNKEGTSRVLGEMRETRMEFLWLKGIQLYNLKEQYKKVYTQMPARAGNMQPKFLDDDKPRSRKICHGHNSNASPNSLVMDEEQKHQMLSFLKSHIHLIMSPLSSQYEVSNLEL